jgi:hypothetical protein
MITIIGSVSIDSTINRFVGFCDQQSISYRVIDLEKILCSRQVSLRSDDMSLTLESDDLCEILDDKDVIYQRAYLPSTVPQARKDIGFRLISDLSSWLTHSGGLVVNRPTAAVSNSCKPLHMVELEDCGLTVPYWEVIGSPITDSLVRPDGCWINKGCCGIRSRAAEVDREMFSNFRSLQSTPSLFQKRIIGEHIRVHFIGSEYLAIGISCASIDYRYLQDGDSRKIRELEIPLHVRLGCLEYMQREGAMFLGFDFIIEQGTELWWLLEANPMPGYDFYDRLVDYKISSLLASLLLGDINQQINVWGPPQANFSVITSARLPIVAR